MVPADVKTAAKKLNDMSLDYHLAHAVFACNKLVEDAFRRYSLAKIKKLKERLLSDETNNDVEKMVELKADIRLLERPFRISVEYVTGMDAEGGRVIKLPESAQFVISLPKKLLDQSKTKDGFYNPDGVKTLRRLMAHELGHIALHIEELLEIDGTQGTKLLSDEAETGADIFAHELLQLRHERNERLYTTGLYKTAF
jgi:Zn-dependent peptidase ImmA (M78 family)